MTFDRKLFTRTDVERGARLAATAAAAGGDVEQCVASAVTVIAEEAPLVYDEPTVKQMLQHVLGQKDVDYYFEEALRAIRQL